MKSRFPFPFARRFAAVVLGLAVGAMTLAQPPGPVEAPELSRSQLRIDHWQTEQGLPLNTVQSIYQTRDGHLWVGTGGGAARFDGLRFSTFEHAGIPEPSARPIFGFHEDSRGTLWIGHSRGASRYRDGRFERAWGDDLMQGRRVWAFAEDKQGVLWAATENGLVRWEKGAAKLYTEADGLPTRRLRSLAFDRDGTLWIGTTGGGLASFAEGRFMTYAPLNGFPHSEVRQVLAHPEGGIWASTAGAGLVRVEGPGRFKRYTVADGLPTDQLTSLAYDASGALWIGTWGAGVARFHEGRFDAIGMGSGLAGDQIWSLHVDREGSVWVGTWHGGLNRLSNRAFRVLGKPEGLSGDNTRAVIHAKDGATWVATAGGGVSRIMNGVISKIGKEQGLPTDEASTLFEDTDGAIWIATYTGGVSRWKDGRAENYGLREGVPNVDVRAVLRDRKGTLWIGTSSGLARLEGRRFVPVLDPAVPHGEGIATLFEDRKGVLWIGTAGVGLLRYHEGRFDVFTRKDGLASNWIVALHEDADGTLWIGTNGEGLSRLRDGRIKSIRLEDGLWDGLAQVLIEDRQGYLWMTCNRGFHRVSRAELNAFADGAISRVVGNGFGPGDALRSTTFAGGIQSAGAIDANGHLWLPSLRGLVIVNPALLPGTGAPPNVVVSDVIVSGTSVERDEDVVLPPGSAPMSIRYAASTLRDADRVRFRYRMDGVTRDWVDAGKTREASFASLPPGRHEFRVAASFDGQRWQEADQALAITVQPHFWQTWWFVLATIAFVLGAGVGAIRLRTHQLRRRADEMERIVAAKTEELRVANEHLSRLSFADALTGLANRRRLDEVLDAEWRRAARMKTPLAVVIGDMDAFKAYNDALGHPEGDRCLVAMADVIRESTSRASDFAARYGGEEFVILLPGSDHAAALAFAEELRKAVEARRIPHPSSTVAPHVTMSLGVAATVPKADGAAKDLFAEADAALYRAKQEGRNRVR